MRQRKDYGVVIHSRKLNAKLDKNANIRCALDEAHRLYRHVDNFFWALSSFLIIGSTLSYAYVSTMSSHDIRVVIFSIIMVIIWYWYLQFLKDTALKIQIYQLKIDELERKIEVDIFPTDMDEIDKHETLNKNIFQYAELLNSIKAKRFHFLMIYITFLSWFLWILQIYSFIFQVLVEIWSTLLKFGIGLVTVIAELIFIYNLV